MPYGHVFLALLFYSLCLFLRKKHILLAPAVVPTPSIEPNTLLSEIDDAMNVLNDSPVVEPVSNILDMFEDDDLDI